MSLEDAGWYQVCTYSPKDHQPLFTAARPTGPKCWLRDVLRKTDGVARGCSRAQLKLHTLLLGGQHIQIFTAKVRPFRPG